MMITKSVKRGRDEEEEEEENNQFTGVKKMQESVEEEEEQQQQQQQQEQEENNELMGVKKVRERTEEGAKEEGEEEEENLQAALEVCAFCAWVCANTHLIKNAITAMTFFTKTLKPTSLSSHATPSLLIPSLFVENHGDKFQSIVSLQVEAPGAGAAAAAAGGGGGDHHRQWSIGITIFQNPVVKVFFVHGWNQFASDHDLQKGDNLIFSLVSLSRFVVHIFDNSGVRKFPLGRRTTSTSTTTTTAAAAACCSSSNRRSSEIDAQCRLRGRQQQQQQQVLLLAGTPRPPQNSTIAETSSSVVDDEQDQVCIPCKNLCLHVRRRSSETRLVGCLNNDTMQAAAAADVPAAVAAAASDGASTRIFANPAFPSFTKMVKKSMLYRPDHHNVSCLVLPKLFWLQYGDRISKSISLRRLSGEEWPVRVWRDQNVVLITAGWKLFSFENGLEEGDELTFRLVSPTCFVVEVHDQTNGDEKPIPPLLTTTTTSPYSINNNSNNKNQSLSSHCRRPLRRNNIAGGSLQPGFILSSSSPNNKQSNHKLKLKKKKKKIQSSHHPAFQAFLDQHNLKENFVTNCGVNNNNYSTATAIKNVMAKSVDNNENKNSSNNIITSILGEKDKKRKKKHVTFSTRNEKGKELLPMRREQVSSLLLLSKPDSLHECHMLKNEQFSCSPIHVEQPKPLLLAKDCSAAAVVEAAATTPNKQQMSLPDNTTTTTTKLSNDSKALHKKEILTSNGSLLVLLDSDSEVDDEELLKSSITFVKKPFSCS